jgi:integrase
MPGKISKRTWTTRKGEEKTAWVVRYPDQSGKWHLHTETTKKGADAWFHKVCNEVLQGVHVPPSGSLTIAEAGQHWLETCTDTKKLERGTLRNYRNFLENHIIPRIGDVKLSQLLPPRLVEFRDALLKDLSRRTAQGTMANLYRLLAHAQEHGWVIINAAEPVERVSLKRRDQAKIQIGRGVPDRQEIAKILDAATPRWRPALTVAALTGLRKGELRALAWDAVDLRVGHEAIDVHRRADQWGALGWPKSIAGQRVIPLGPAVAQVLREWRVAYPFDREKGVVFCTFNRATKGGILGHHDLWDAFRAAQLRAGVVNDAGRAKYTFHALRHFYASICIAGNQFSPKELQVLLGHASIQMTYDTYGHLFPNPVSDRVRLAAIERSIFVAFAAPLG